MKKISKLFGLSLCALGLGVFAQSASADVLQDIVKRGELRVAVQTQGPPVSFVDKNGERTGFAIEVVKMMADDMGVELMLLDFDWKGADPSGQFRQGRFSGRGHDAQCQAHAGVELHRALPLQ